MNYGGVRLATPDDAEAMLKIYSPYVRDTVFTFEYDPPTVEEFRARIEKTLEQYPWFLFEINGEVLGYAYAGPNYTRPAYSWTAETSVYVAPRMHGKGMAVALYTSLEDALTAQGYRVIYALVCGENAPSMAFHKKQGFHEIGLYKKTGFKMGRWLDVAVLEKVLDSSGEPPAAPPLPIKQLSYWECVVETSESGEPVVKDERYVDNSRA